MMTEEQHLANALTAFIGRPLDNPLTRSEIMETARIPLAAITQPASTALKLPDDWVAVPLEPTEEMISAGDRFMDGLSRLGDAYEAMLDAAPAVPHTAPIEPICATGGAEWVKVSERMPEECEPVIVVDNGIDVYPAVFSNGKFYEYGDTFTPCLMSNPTHWMPLPAAPTS